MNKVKLKEIMTTSLTEELVQHLHQERNETAVNLVNLEERSQGDGAIMAKEV